MIKLHPSPSPEHMSHSSTHKGFFPHSLPPIAAIPVLTGSSLDHQTQVSYPFCLCDSLDPSLSPSVCLSVCLALSVRFLLAALLNALPCVFSRGSL
jgi:hypothetical protein